MKKRIAAALCLVVFALCPFCFILPQPAHAQTAGETLIVRVQYAGEWEDKIREKARFSNSQLRAMGNSQVRYTNVTDVGTVLSILAKGPRLSAVIEAAGIDMNSVKYITFRTLDGTGADQRYTRNFTVAQHLTAARYYYPKLQKNYERHDDNTLTPLTGSLAGRVAVPSILALESYSTKQPSKVPQTSDLTTDEAYRFCLGQTALEENVKTRPGYGGGDVTAMESTQVIFGMDVTLYGSPVTGISLNLDDKDLKVGSRKKISAVIEGDELFADDWGIDTSELRWSSSDESVASVDQNGVITIKKKGSAVITATAPNGMTASVTINAAEGDKAGEKPAAAAKKAADSQREKTDKTSPDKGKSSKKEKKAAGIVVKEVRLGGVLEEETAAADAGRQDMAEDAEALGKAEESNPKAVFVSAYTSILVFGFGIALRVRRYMKEV